MTKVHLLAPIGLSPAVVTETIWWLTHRRAATIARVEVWFAATTQRPLLIQQLDRLRKALGEERLPADALDVRTFEGLDDIATEADARRVLTTLAGRVKELSDTLPPDVALVGLLSGGRKTMSASMMAAFSLYARSQDPLLHVWLDPQLEARLRERGELTNFVFPEPRWAEYLVDGAEQIVVHEQPYPSFSEDRTKPMSARLGGPRWPHPEPPRLIVRCGEGRGQSWVELDGAPDTRASVKPGWAKAYLRLLNAKGAIPTDAIGPAATQRYLQQMALRVRPLCPEAAPTWDGRQWDILARDRVRIA